MALHRHANNRQTRFFEFFLLFDPILRYIGGRGVLLGCFNIMPKSGKQKKVVLKNPLFMITKH